jgi:hypothetical protein
MVFVIGCSLHTKLQEVLMILKLPHKRTPFGGVLHLSLYGCYHGKSPIPRLFQLVTLSTIGLPMICQVADVLKGVI